MKEGFIIYTAYAKKFRRLSDAQFGQLIRALIDYQTTGNPPEIIDPAVGMAFDVVKVEVDAANVKYNEIVEKRREAGKNRFKANDNTNEQMLANDNKCEQMLANETISEQMQASASYKDKDKDKDKDIFIADAININNRRVRKYDPDTVDPGEINRLFVEFWELYPKKTNQDAACRAWVSMVDSVELAQEIIQAVKENNRRNTSWKRNGGRYVPNAENWLFDRRWRDEIREEKDDSPKEKDPFQVEGSGFEFMDDKWLEDFKERKRIEKEKLLKEKKEAALHGADTNAANMG